MKTIQINIENDKLATFLTIVKNLKPNLIKSINIIDDALDIEPISKDNYDYLTIISVKEENNTKYFIDEVKEILDI